MKFLVVLSIAMAVFLVSLWGGFLRLAADSSRFSRAFQDIVELESGDFSSEIQDPWGRPYQEVIVARPESDEVNHAVISFGPNGVYDNLTGDDISRFVSEDEWITRVAGFMVIRSRNTVLLSVGLLLGLPIGWLLNPKLSSKGK
jgi:hypothetical protein